MIKDRLHLPLKAKELNAIKPALIDFMVDKGTDPDHITFDANLIRNMVPYLREANEGYKGLEPKDMLTTHHSVKQIY